MNPPRNNAETTRGRPFATGNAGRPRGARNRTSLAVEALLEGEAERLTRRAIEAALGGDVTALRLCLDRISPVRRDRCVRFEVPSLEGLGSLPGAVAMLLQAVAAGDLTPSEAASVGSLLDRWREAVELADLEARIKALEDRGS